MLSSKIKVLALSVMVLGAASLASAGGDCCKKNGSKASFTSNEATNGASKMSKEACAAKMAAGECKDSKSKGSTVSFAGANGHCATTKGASMADYTYGESSVTFAGTCPVGNDADFSFAIAGAESKGTGAAAAKAIKSVKGVASVTVDYDKHMAYVCADKRSVNKKAIEKSLRSAGFDEVKFVSASKENCAKSHGKIDA